MYKTNANRNDEYGRFQETTSRKQGAGVDRRLEIGRSSLQSLQSSVRAKFILIYTNGEQYIHDKPIQVSFSRKKFPQLYSLLDEIARGKERINKTSVRYLFKWPSGEEVRDVADIDKDEETYVYVCSDVKKLYKSANYGGIEFGSSGLAAEPTDKQSRNSYNSRTGRLPNARSPINITVISNTNRQSKQSLFVDPQSKQPFEEILRNVTEMLDMENPPCKALYSTKPPFRKVDSISSFNRIAQTYGDTFWACGSEGEPIEKSSRTPRDASPMRNNNSQRQKNVSQQDSGYRPRQNNGNVRSSETNGTSQGRKDERRERQPPSNRQRQIEDKQSPSKQENKRDSRQRLKVEQSPNGEEITNDYQYDQDENPNSMRNDNSRDVGQEHLVQRKSTEEQATKRKEDKIHDRHESLDRENDNHQTTLKQTKDQEQTKHDISGNYVDDGNFSQKDYPSEAEMSNRIAEMERMKSDVDKDIEY